MAKEKVTKSLTTIVSVDVAGYSRLMEANEAATLAALKAHRKVIDPKIGEHGGRIVGTAGDGLLIEFSSVSDSVSCAVEVNAPDLAFFRRWRWQTSSCASPGRCSNAAEPTKRPRYLQRLECADEPTELKSLAG